MVCTFINNNIHHHSGKNFVYISWVHNKSWPLWWPKLLSIRVQTMLQTSNKTIISVLNITKEYRPQWRLQIKLLFQCLTIAWQVDASIIICTLINKLIKLQCYCQLWLMLLICKLPEAYPQENNPLCQSKSLSRNSLNEHIYLWGKCSNMFH